MIAIVDDDDAVRRALIRLVRALSYRCADFPSGASFIESLGDMTPDCVLLDYHMPEANGVQVIKSMKMAGFSIPAIMMSGFDRPELRMECLNAGAAMYLLKPLTAATLSDAFGRALQSGRDLADPNKAKKKTILRCVPAFMI